jgi:NAD(P)-dependent dehydrogenase (short-subunit alcohol dehydrogenase family)
MENDMTRTWIVTGSSVGLGLAIIEAALAADHGHCVKVGCFHATKGRACFDTRLGLEVL